jgi:hypothetical protein
VPSLNRTGLEISAAGIQHTRPARWPARATLAILPEAKAHQNPNTVRVQRQHGEPDIIRIFSAPGSPNMGKPISSFFAFCDGSCAAACKR